MSRYADQSGDSVRKRWLCILTDSFAGRIGLKHGLDHEHDRAGDETDVCDIKNGPVERTQLEMEKITGNGMAFDTLVPLLLMLPGIDRKVEIVVVEGRRNPGSFTVT